MNITNINPSELKGRYDDTSETIEPAWLPKYIEYANNLVPVQAGADSTIAVPCSSCKKLFLPMSKKSTSLHCYNKKNKKIITYGFCSPGCIKYPKTKACCLRCFSVITIRSSGKVALGSINNVADPHLHELYIHEADFYVIKLMCSFKCKMAQYDVEKRREELKSGMYCLSCKNRTETLLKCPCGDATFCNKKCQIAAWPAHKNKCSWYIKKMMNNANTQLLETKRLLNDIRNDKHILSEEILSGAETLSDAEILPGAEKLSDIARDDPVAKAQENFLSGLLEIAKGAKLRIRTNNDQYENTNKLSDSDNKILVEDMIEIITRGNNPSLSGNQLPSLDFPLSSNTAPNGTSYNGPISEKSVSINCEDYSIKVIYGDTCDSYVLISSEDQENSEWTNIYTVD